MVTCPGASAVMSGGSSVDRLATLVLLEAQVKPEIVAPVASCALMLRVSPTSILSRLGNSETLLPPPEGGTMNCAALLHTSFRRMRAIPVFAAGSTTATTWVSLQVLTIPWVLPSHTSPLPCAVPNPVPVIVTLVPGAPEAGLTLVICGVMPSKLTELLH